MATSMKIRLKTWAKNLKKQVYVLYLAYRDPRTPWIARLFTGLVVAYAFSPIDLIPDFIPVLGFLDDIILVPLGIIIAFKMIPDVVIADCRLKAEAMMQKDRPRNWAAAVFIIIIWIMAAGWILILINRYLL